MQFHPSPHFIHCPKCGSSTFEWTDDRYFLCTTCRFQFFLNPAAAVAAFIRNENKEILFTIRQHDPAKGLFDLPGGFIDFGETAEDALVREVKEETGADLIIDQYLFSRPNTYLYNEVTYQTLDMAFLCHFEGTPDLVVSEEISSVIWADPSAIPPEKIGLTSIRQMVQMFLNR